MRAISLPRRLFALALGSALPGLAAACGDALTLPPARFSNVIDTVTLHALSGTAISQPSAFDVVFGQTVRTERGAAFDFAFDIEGDGIPRFYPAGTLGLSTEPGLLRETRAFAEVLSAPLDGYVSDSTLVATVGMVFVVRSRNSTAQCTLAGVLPRYGKFHVLAVDLQARTVTLELLVDLNCGYRGLEPGVPDA